MWHAYGVAEYITSLKTPSVTNNWKNVVIVPYSKGMKEERIRGDQIAKHDWKDT